MAVQRRRGSQKKRLGSSMGDWHRMSGAVLTRRFKSLALIVAKNEAEPKKSSTIGNNTVPAGREVCRAVARWLGRCAALKRSEVGGGGGFTKTEKRVRSERGLPLPVPLPPVRTHTARTTKRVPSRCPRARVKHKMAQIKNRR